MEIRQLPSGAFQVRFQHHRTSHAATYLTRALAEEAEPLLRAEALAGRRDESDADAVIAPQAQRRTQDPPRTPTPHQVRASSASAAELMDMILADVIEQHVVPAPPHDEVLTTSQAAVLLGISRPTLVAWLEAGRIPFQRRGTHRRVTRSGVLAHLDRLP